MSFPKTLEWKQIQFSETKSFPWYNISFCRAQVKPGKTDTGLRALRISIWNKNYVNMWLAQDWQRQYTHTQKIFHLFVSHLSWRKATGMSVCFLIQSLTRFSVKTKMARQVYHCKWEFQNGISKSPLFRKVCHLELMMALLPLLLWDCH